MTTSGLLSEAELRRRFLECSVCLQNFDEDKHQPHTLPCYHVCCFSCLRNILKDSKVTCPLCKITHEVKDNNINVFPKDNTRRDMLDFLSQKSRLLVPTRCTNCDENDAETRCDSCQDSLCALCTSAHIRTRKTSGHVLVSVTQQPADSLGELTDPSHCGKPGHGSHLLDKYCSTESCRHLVCALCCRDAHQNHFLKPVNEVYIIRKTELLALTDKLQSKRRSVEEDKIALENEIKSMSDNENVTRANIEQSFEAGLNILKRRRDDLIYKFNLICGEKRKSLDAQLSELSFQDTEILNVLSLATQTLEANEISLLKLDTALKLKIDCLLNRVSSYRSSEHVAKAKVTAYLGDVIDRFEDFAKHIGAISETDVAVQRTKVTLTDAVVGVPTVVLELRLYSESGKAVKTADIGIEVEVLSDQFVTNTLKAQFNDKTNSYSVSLKPERSGKYKISVLILGEKLKQELFFHVSDSSANTGVQPIQPKTLSRSQSADRPKLENLKSYSTENSSETTRVKDIPGAVSVTDSFSSLDALQYCCSPAVTSVVHRRFETWNLIGEWERGPGESGELMMHSRSEDEARLCLQILKETVLEKVIPVRPETMVVLESDKWQGVIGSIKRKSTSPYDLVEIFVDRANTRILCYSLSTVALRDAADAIFIFLRDNDMKVLQMKYTEDIGAVVKQEGQNKVKTIQNSLSQFCINIKGEKNVIEVKGIGLGIGKAVLEVNKMAKEVLEAADEERFSSDDEEDDENKDEDDLSRFERTAIVICEIKMNMTECKFHGIYMIGDDRMVFVSEGDLTTFRVDALVNAADKRLRHDGGLSKAIVLKGGYSIQVECSEFVASKGEVKEGSVFSSHPGKLDCYIIIHAVGPVWRGGSEGERKKLSDTVNKILKEANTRKLASVAIPALCTGKNKFPPREASLCIINAIKDFFNQNPRTVLREVHLCDRDEACIQTFTEVCNDVFGVKEAVIVSQSSKPSQHTGQKKKEADVKSRIQTTLIG